MRKTLVFGRYSEISRKPFELLEIVENVSKTKRRKNTAQLYSAYLKYFVFHGGMFIPGWSLIRDGRLFEVGPSLEGGRLFEVGPSLEGGRLFEVGPSLEGGCLFE